MNRATDELIELLRQGSALLETLTDEEYRGGVETETEAWSSPGAHARHLLDFVDCLLAGLDARRIDYTARKRRSDVEDSRECGCSEIARTIEDLEGLRGLDARLPIEVRPEPAQAWSQSTLARELQFVSSHVVHHHALIRMTLAHRGIEAPPEFGVAPSTLDHRAQDTAREQGD